MLDHETRRRMLSAFPHMRQLGFTLIELMIGVVVLAILLSIGL
ncbi:MAG: type IV pilin protein, partial [Sideroxydans sp.]